MRVGTLWLSFSPSLPLFHDPQRRCLILGLALDPSDPLATEERICLALSRVPCDMRQDEIDRLVGRFVIILVDDDGQVRVQQDAMGLRAAYYTSSQYVPVVGSHMALVSSQVGAKHSQYGARGYLQQANEKTYPGRMTARLGVMRLTPNTEWSSLKQSVRRIFPSTLRVERAVPDVAREITSDVQAIVVAMEARQTPLVVSLTAGLDSRVTTSFLLDSSNVEFFTYDVRYREKNRANRHDVNAATELASRLSLKHRVVALEGEPVPHLLDEAINRNWPLKHARELAAAYRSEFPNVLHLRSSGFGIANAYWRSHGFGDVDLDAREMRRIASSKKGRDLASLDAFQEYINSTSFSTVGSLGYDPYDFFLWEMRVGSWLATALHESDVAHDTLVLINSRRIVNALLSVPLSDRLGAAVSRAILANSRDDLLDVPVNGEPFYAVREAAGEVVEADPISQGQRRLSDAPITIDVTKAQQAAARQSNGPGFEETPRDADLVDALLASEVVLPPHPAHLISSPVDWSQDPFAQRNWRAQLHMLRWLDPLRRVSQTRPERRAELMAVWDKYVREWCDGNLVRRSAASPAWLSMTDAVRVEALVNGLPLSSDPERILSALEVHGRWLADERHIGHSNHALRQHSALFQIGAVLGRGDWKDIALQRLRAHSLEMFDHEGMNSEGAVRYWEMNRRWAKTIAWRIEKEGHNSTFIQGRLYGAAEALAFATRPDGGLETLGDSDPSTPKPDGTDVLEYVASRGSRGQAPSDVARVYQRGFAFGRSGWGEMGRSFEQESFYSLIFGSSTKVHGHEDAGSVTFSANGHRVLVDAGKFAYVSSPEREYCQSREGHNVVTIDGVPRDPDSEVNLESHSLGDQLDWYALRDTGYRDASINRFVVFSRATDTLLVVDTVRTKASAQVQARWHLSPDAKTEIDGAAVRVTIGDKEFTLLWGGSKPDLEVVRGKKDPLDGWFSPGWNKLVPSDVVVATRTGKTSRTAMMIQPAATDARLLQSFPTRDGIGYVARGKGAVECILVEKGSARSVPCDESSLPSLIKRLRDPEVAVRKEIVRQAKAPRSLKAAVQLDSDVARARATLGGNQSTTPEIAESLATMISKGFDQGANAALLDIRATAAGLSEGPSSGGVPYRNGFSFDPRTKGVTLRGRRIGYQSFSRDDLQNPDWTSLKGEALHVYNIGSLSLPLLYRPGRGQTLLVCFAGAQDRAKTALPRFEWHRQFSDLNVPQLFVSDPTLDLAPDLRLGWYLGSAGVDASATIAKLVGDYAQRLAVDSVLLMGTSGGGFAAMQTGAMVPGARVLAVNPQTDVREYVPRYSQQALRRVFGTSSPGPGLDARLSVADRLMGEGNEVAIEIVLNEGDSHHTSRHVEPLLHSTAHMPYVDCTLKRVSWGPGHVVKADEVMAMVERKVMTV